MEDYYDYIVVGMGAGGATVLRMLSDAGYSVLGIEAGGNHDKDPLILDSVNAPLLEPLYTYKYLWNQETAPNPSLDNRSLNYTTGQLLGGGTSINGLQYVRSTNSYWSRWEAINGSYWSPSKVIRRYKKLEKYFNVPPSTVYGTKGLMKIRKAPIEQTSMAIKFTTALARATGVNMIDDYNDPNEPIGVFTRWTLFEQPNGNRASSSTDFLEPIRCKLLTNSVVDKVIIDSKSRVKGVNVMRNGKCKKIYANREVILSTGIHSNEILQRSGIGPKAYLESLNINVVFDNPAVGAMSRNHLINIAAFTINPLDYPGTGTDPNALYVGGGFIPAPNIPGKRGFQWIGINPSEDQFVVAFYNLNPSSVGTDQIQSKNPFQVSAVKEDLLGNPVDLESIVAVYQQQVTQLAINLAAIDPRYQLVSPTLEVINNTKLLKEFIIETLEHAHHWTGTCRMAPLNQGGVVDMYGKVYGVKGLRVADISVAPIEPDGNTAGPAFQVGYAIAQNIIKNGI